MAEQSTMSMPGSPFPNDSLGPLQEPWLHLLEYGTFPEQAVPDSWMVQPEWVDLLEKSADEGWLASLHRGVMRYHRGDVAGAKSAWERSLEKKRNIWALRNLAQLARFEGQLDTAVPLLLRAREIAPEVETLAVECVECLLEAGLSGQAMEIFQQMPHRLVQQGRLRALHAKAALADGHLDLAESLLGPDLVVANLREGEQSLHLLWWDLQEQREAGGGAVTEDIRRRVREQPIPSHLDFRQSS
jgi:tetratricopeptide (TPR) repeat protein